MSVEDQSEHKYDKEAMCALIKRTPLNKVIKRYTLTSEFNAHLSKLLKLTDATQVVPVFSNDTCEDVIRLSRDNAVLDGYIKEAFARIDSPIVIRAIREVFSPAVTCIGEYFKKTLKETKNLHRERVTISAMYEQFVLVCPDSTRVDFYTLIEEIGATEGLLYDLQYPLEKRKEAIRLAGQLVCTNSKNNRKVLVMSHKLDVLVVCVALATTVHVLKDERKGSNNRYSMVSHFNVMSKKRCQDAPYSHFYHLPLYILKVYKDIEPELAREFDREIRLSLALMEKMHSLDILKLIHNNKGPFKSNVVDTAHELLPERREVVEP